MRRLLTITLALALTLTAGAEADDRVLAPAPGATGLDAGAGSVVWNAPVSGGWALMHLRAGVVTQLPIRLRSSPFDADVGTDRHGRPTVVYSRCVGETGDGCSIHALTLDGSGGERRVGDLDYERLAASETAPAIRRGAIAYSSRVGDTAFPRLLMREADGHVHELSAGSQQAEGGGATIADTDLGGGGVAYVWRMSGGLVYGVGDVTELRLAPTDGRASVLMDSGLVGEGCGEYRPFAPTAGSPRVDYLAAGTDCAGTTEFAAFDLRTGFRMRAPLSGSATGFAGSGGTRFTLRARRPGDCCELVVSKGVVLTADRLMRGTGPHETAQIPGHRWVRGPLGSRLLRPPARIDCIPTLGGVLVSVGAQARAQGRRWLRAVLSGLGRPRRYGPGYAVGNQFRLARCGRTYRVEYRVSRTRNGPPARRTFTVRVLRP